MTLIHIHVLISNTPEEVYWVDVKHQTAVVFFGAQQLAL